ncbi:Phasin domain-containing protein [Bordetella sputigena]|uniref:hypothetical protein n=1 Tax=Bordetella sputigena TaxID=1416810 RepID=UPI0039F04CBB
MAIDNTLPLGLLKASLELHLRIAQLLHENGQRWLELSSRVSQEGIDEYKAEIGNLTQTENWQTLATLPSEAFWRQLQQRFADTQNCTQQAIEAQGAFTNGLQQAIQSWQKAAIGSTDTTNIKLPFLEYFKNWGTNWAAATTPKKGASNVQ